MVPTEATKAEWRDDFVMDNGPLDQQHMGLFQAYNSLVAIHNGETDQSPTEIISQLIDYIEQHFSDEENLWKTDKATHNKQRKEHTYFVKQVMQLSGKDLKHEAITDDSLIFLRSWLIDHIIKRDIPDYLIMQERKLITK